MDIDTRIADALARSGNPLLSTAWIGGTTAQDIEAAGGDSFVWLDATGEQVADDAVPDIPTPQDILPDWVPWAVGGTLGVVGLALLAYAFGQLFSYEVSS